MVPQNFSAALLMERVRMPSSILLLVSAPT